MRKSFNVFLLSLLLVVCGINGCNTVAGAGEDVQAGGKAIQRAAE